MYTGEQALHSWSDWGSHNTAGHNKRYKDVWLPLSWDKNNYTARLLLVSYHHMYENVHKMMERSFKCLRCPHKCCTCTFVSESYVSICKGFAQRACNICAPQCRQQMHPEYFRYWIFKRFNINPNSGTPPYQKKLGLVPLVVLLGGDVVYTGC